uniref:Uncharacterized protein n=1 Tax=Cacopsylla melanoneura TaxID=428564 RepID=A0A8D8XH39_9HEMI
MKIWSMIQNKISEFSLKIIFRSWKMSTIFLLALLLVVFTLVQSTDRQIRQGLIVPPTGSHSANGTNALYYPSGKPAAPTKLPGGIKIPSVPLYSPGKVVTKPADSASSTNQHQEVNQPHQQQQQQTHTHTHFLTYLLTYYVAFTDHEGP